MKEILRQIKSEKKDIERQFVNNVEKIILPIVDKLKWSASSIEVGYLNLIEINLREIASPFLSTLSAKYSKLTPREVEVCNMIKNGLSSKEIANLLSISTLTVHRYREFIRRKLGITNKDVGMQTFLNTEELH
jgi:DNA-binding CsgD family transcriptional regulator